MTAAMALARLTAARAESVDACANDTDRAHSFGATEILAISAENLTPTTERNHCSDRKRTQTMGDLSISAGTQGFWFVFKRGPSSGGNLNIVLCPWYSPALTALLRPEGSGGSISGRVLSIFGARLLLIPENRCPR